MYLGASPGCWRKPVQVLCVEFCVCRLGTANITRRGSTINSLCRGQVGGRGNDIIIIKNPRKGAESRISPTTFQNDSFRRTHRARSWHLHHYYTRMCCVRLIYVYRIACDRAASARVIKSGGRGVKPFAGRAAGRDHRPRGEKSPKNKNPLIHYNI